MSEMLQILKTVGGFNLSTLITVGIVFLLFYIFQKSETLNEFCRHEIQDIDEDRREELLHITQDNIFTLAMNKMNETSKCNMVKRALVDATISPLVESINTNHFTGKLSPEHFSSFRMRLFKRMQENYTAISFLYSNEFCKEDVLKEWKEKKEFCDYVLTSWLSELSLSVSNACERKLEVYKKYLPHFKFTLHYKGLVNERIKRNRQYIEDLQALHAKLKKELT